MSRIRSLHTLAAVALLAVAPAVEAAEVTRVLSAADEDHPFDVDVSLVYRHGAYRGQVKRETWDPGTGKPIDASELRYTRTVDMPSARLAFGLYHDLELHVELPYSLGDDRSWRYASGVSNASSSIFNEAYDASGALCPGGPGSCPIFPIGQTSYHDKVFADMKVGVAYGILSQRRDDTKPTWVVGLEVTLPTGTKYDPSTAPSSYDKKTPAPLGERIWRYDVWTALSRQFGRVDPYVRLHASFPAQSGTTYSNCDRAAALAATTPPQPQMASGAPAGCAAWGTAADAKPPQVLGMDFGTELVAYQNPREDQRVAFDLRVGADWTTASRWFNELTDATGKLMHTDGYATLRAQGGLYLRASRHVQLRLQTAFSWNTDHFISGEPLYRQGAAGANPNYDWRYDPVGLRFRITESTLLDLGATAMFSF